VQYTSDRSQLLEILCISWPESVNTLSNFEKYPEVMPQVMSMMAHKSICMDVASVHLNLLKKLIVDTLDSDEQSVRALKN